MKRTIPMILMCATLLAVDEKIDGQRWWSHVQFLADDKLEGRNTGSEGHRKAALYVADHFARYGLRPAGSKGYFQPVKFISRTIVEAHSSLALIRDGKMESLTLGEDAVFSMRIEPARTVRAPLVFAGYGLSVPELKYDDLSGLDLKGKIAVVFSGGPSSIPGPLRSHYQSAGERWKTFKAAGALGLVTIQDPSHMDIPWRRSSQARLQPAMTLSEPGLVDTRGQQLAISVNPAHAYKFFAGSGHTFEEIRALSDKGLPLPRFALGASMAAEVVYEKSVVESQNVIGILPGTDPKLRAEHVVLSAHLDHLGVGAPINDDRVYNGAMDNAAGVSTLLEIAQSLHESKISLRRSLLLVIVTAEEKGLLGSKYFTAHPTVNPRSMVADLNLDMFLPVFPLRILTVMGLDESDLGRQVREAAESLQVRVQPDPEPQRNLFIRSDQYNFIRRGIPSLAFKVGYEKGSAEAETARTWLTERYHAPSDDTSQPVDLVAASRFNQLILALTQKIANDPRRPDWNPKSFFRRYTGKPSQPPKT